MVPTSSRMTPHWCATKEPPVHKRRDPPRRADPPRAQHACMLAPFGSHSDSPPYSPRKRDWAMVPVTPPQDDVRPRSITGMRERTGVLGRDSARGTSPPKLPYPRLPPAVARY